MRYYRRNADIDFRSLEREYSATGDLNSLTRLNIARVRNGLKPVCAADRELRGFLRDAGFNIEPMDGLQFTGYRITIRGDTPGSPYHLGRFEEVEDATNTLREAIRSTHALGYFGLINLGEGLWSKYGREPCYECGSRNTRPSEMIIEPGRYSDDFARSVDITCSDCSSVDSREVDPPAYPVAYLFCYSLLEPTGDPVDLRDFARRGQDPGSGAGLVADQWMRHEDPRSLIDPAYRRGSYPTKVVLVRRPGTTWIKGVLTHTDDIFITWKYYVSYEDEVSPSLGSGNYDMHPIEDGYVDYLKRLLMLPREHDYELVY